MPKEKLSRLDADQEIRRLLLPGCRLKYGHIWEDPIVGHRVGCLDATDSECIRNLILGDKATLAIQDPPYNVVVGNTNSANLGRMSLREYVEWSRRWVSNTSRCLEGDASLYVWLGADQNSGFQPLPDFMLLMREFSEFRTRSFITMRNQRGYGTQKNWMAVRQELLYYVRGNPCFNVEAEYTDIPKILRGYYKTVNGEQTENLQRSKSENIRAGNVWVDIQQVFYRLKENVSGCYAQKPLKAIERIISASSLPRQSVLDFFAHSGTTLVACEKLKRRCITCDIDPVFAEITIRRLEHYRETGETGWQFDTPFPEVNYSIKSEQDNSGIQDSLENSPKRSLFDYLEAPR